MSTQQQIWDTIFTKNKNIVARKIADEMFLVPIHGNMADMQRIFALNPVAEFIWEHVDGKHSVRELRDKVLEEFDVEQPLADADILDFLENMQQIHVLMKVV